MLNLLLFEIGISSYSSSLKHSGLCSGDPNQSFGLPSQSFGLQTLAVQPPKFDSDLSQFENSNRPDRPQSCKFK